jgi:hypothetical protein
MPPFHPGVPLHGPADVIPPPATPEVPEVEDPPSPESPGRPVKDPPVEPLEDVIPEPPPGTWKMDRESDEACRLHGSVRSGSVATPALGIVLA